MSGQTQWPSFDGNVPKSRMEPSVFLHSKEERMLHFPSPAVAFEELDQTFTDPETSVVRHRS